MMPRSTKPARGLSALIPKDVDEVLGQRGDTPYYTELPIEQISTNPYQPRRSFDEEALDELAASIKHNGLIQSIVVRPTDSGLRTGGGGATPSGLEARRNVDNLCDCPDRR